MPGTEWAESAVEQAGPDQGVPLRIQAAFGPVRQAAAEILAGRGSEDERPVAGTRRAFKRPVSRSASGKARKPRRFVCGSFGLHVRGYPRGVRHRDDGVRGKREIREGRPQPCRRIFEDEIRQFDDGRRKGRGVSRRA